MFVPTSHTIGKLTGISLVEPQDIFEFAKESEAATKKPVIVRMKAGSCTFHNGLTFHYAHSNTTDKPRRVLAVIYMPDGMIYTGGRHVVTDNAGQVAGQPFGGGVFPKLA
jgi:ectoine hydroxylase-related dioxygenase (phytanoyl-CoA dioxygenase family)